MTVFARVQAADFDPAGLQEALLPDASAGALVTFTGLVRRDAGDTAFRGLYLEHYPGMTERAIEAILEEAAARWSILAAGAVHRVGELPAGARIVWVGAAAAHRGDAFAACEFAMDFLKTRAPFWKKERRDDGSYWVEARAGDCERAGRWTRRDS